MHLPVRFVLAKTIIVDPAADEDGQVKSMEAEERWVDTSVDLWQVSEVTEGWSKGTVDLHYYDGDTRTVKGKFSDWYDKHVHAKMDELQLVRFPALN